VSPAEIRRRFEASAWLVTLDSAPTPVTARFHLQQPFIGWVFTNEELMIARHTGVLLGISPPPDAQRR
jgi:hypothetical protein